jgi:hypothetical protein
MTSSSSTQAEPLFDDGAPPTVPQAPFGVEETLAKLAQQAASDTREAQPREPASDKATDAPVSQSSAAATLASATATLGSVKLGSVKLGPVTLGPADLRAQIPREPPSRGKRPTLARVAIAVCLVAAAIWAWRSYGGGARAMVAAWASPAAISSAQPAADQASVSQAPAPASTQAAAVPAVEQAAPMAPPATTTASAPAASPVDHQQNDTMARDIAALRQTVEQLTAAQAQLKGQIARLQAEKVAAEKPPTEKPKKRVVRHVPAAVHYPDAFDPAQSPGAPGAPRTIGSVVVHREAPPPAYGVSTVSPLPPPQPAGPQRPPMPVPQP